jgi:peroxiredoxin
MQDYGCHEEMVKIVENMIQATDSQQDVLGLTADKKPVHREAGKAEKIAFFQPEVCVTHKVSRP